MIHNPFVTLFTFAYFVHCRSSIICAYFSMAFRTINCFLNILVHFFLHKKYALPVWQDAFSYLSEGHFRLKNFCSFFLIIIIHPFFSELCETYKYLLIILLTKLLSIDKLSAICCWVIPSIKTHLKICLSLLIGIVSINDSISSVYSIKSFSFALKRLTFFLRSFFLFS